MPVYEYRCPTCGNREDKICKWKDARNQSCSVCESTLQKLVSSPARTTISWNAEWTNGLSHTAKYDVGLGQTVYSEQHRDRVLKRKGLVRESEIGSDNVDKVISKQKEEKKQLDQFSRDYQSNIKKYGGDKQKAIVETLPAKQILNS